MATPILDPVDNSSQSEYFDNGEGGSESPAKSVDWFLSKTGSERPEKVKFEDDQADPVENSSGAVVESEQDTDDPAQDAEGQPDQAEPAKDNSSPGPEADGEPVLLAGKFETQDALLKGYNHLERRATLLSQQLQQAQWQLQQVAAQAQTVADPAPKRWEQMTPAEQEQLQTDAYREGLSIEEVLTDRRAEWKTRQVLREREQQFAQAQQQQRQGHWDEAVRELAHHADSYDDHRDHVLQQFEQMPELYEFFRSTSPEVMLRVGRTVLDGLAASARLKTMEAQQGAVAQAARRAGREEAHQGKTAKANATRTQAARVNTVSPNLQSAPAKPTTRSYIQQLREARPQSTWE